MDNLDTLPASSGPTLEYNPEVQLQWTYSAEPKSSLLQTVVWVEDMNTKDAELVKNLTPWLYNLKLSKFREADI